MKFQINFNLVLASDNFLCKAAAILSLSLLLAQGKV